MEKELIAVDDEMIEDMCTAYSQWKNLNSSLKKYGRGQNMPDSISETIICHCLGLRRNGNGVPGDATAEDGSKVECKASSKLGDDLSSFGPKTEFDDLVFCEFDTEKDCASIYDLGLDSDTFGNYPVSKTETVKEQRDRKRRPRLSLYKTIIEPNDMKPTVVFDINKRKIIEDNRTA